MKPILIATVGLPRSGKSTLLRNLNKDFKAPIVSRDAIRMALHGRAYEDLAEGFTRAIYGVMIRSLFEAGHEMVLADETHYSKAARDFVRDDSRWSTIFYKVEALPSTCIERAKDTNQRYLIPVIEEMYARYDPIQPDEVIVYNDLELTRLIKTYTEMEKATS